MLAASTTSVFLFFFNDTATTEIYTLSLHDALPILAAEPAAQAALAQKILAVDTDVQAIRVNCQNLLGQGGLDRKSTRLNSSHQIISYAVFCLKKKNHTPLKRLRHDATPGIYGTTLN